MITDTDRINFLEELIKHDDVSIKEGSPVEIFTVPAQWVKGATVREALDNAMQFGVEDEDE